MWLLNVSPTFSYHDIWRKWTNYHVVIIATALQIKHLAQWMVLSCVTQIRTSVWMAHLTERCEIAWDKCGQTLWNKYASTSHNMWMLWSWTKYYLANTSNPYKHHNKRRQTKDACKNCQRSVCLKDKYMQTKCIHMHINDNIWELVRRIDSALCPVISHSDL